MPQRFVLSRAKDWRKPEGGVVCTRPGRWGNPYVVGAPIDLRQVNRWGWLIKDKQYVAATVEDAVRRFAHCLLFDGAMHDVIRRELGGRDLGCWCDLDALCHVDPLMALANSTREDVNRVVDCIDAQIQRQIKKWENASRPKRQRRARA
jgi:hypothetical protein